MLEAIRRAISFLRHRQILHKLGVVVSITVIGIACYVLYHMLKGIDTDEVIEAIKGTEPRSIALAALFVAAADFVPLASSPDRNSRSRCWKQYAGRSRFCARSKSCISSGL